MSDSDSEQEQRLTLEDLEYSDAEMLSGDEDDPMDIFTTQKVTINNEPALKRLHDQIALPTDIPWSETQSITSTQPVSVADPDDDLNREVAFYNQALEAAVLGRERIRKEGGVFERPGDYFAEMIKSDEHMAKIRQKLLDENASIQASERAKAQRELKKFGKKVQTEKRLEREKAKAEALEKINVLKKKRQGNDSSANADDEFDVALASDDEEMRAYKTTGRNGNKGKKRSASSTPESRGKRLKKDQKFGFGGKKRHAKSNTADSSADVSAFNVKRNKSTSFKAGHKATKTAAKKRPGKARRQSGGGRK
ncbi:rRNA-processing protein and EBNA1-binding protein ebp2 [Entomortierella chlamydospora]|uniref:rRNA-processing protein and EBNA1-binding protein ebp2 n=1 Tax=Entomortierella chlamydospora TaxID=101097 RepID=A0A9P6MXM0_9FUNG|nr:rRNA-processing protein and EBNA1-binding protein ebp2 [Entomortierella chlamydospora]KAG0016367.1 rRNA-processing protein and EBNA1-binding protein ebp2 [Entomortierella chlamydospora]